MLVRLVSVAFRDPSNQSPWSLCWPRGLWGVTDWAVCLATVSIAANGGSGPDGKAIAMMLSASLCAASAILSASTGLVIN